MTTLLPKTSWRLIIHPAAPGAWNMAVDEAILESTAGQLQPPTLRLYAWEPACLSLGFSQPAADADQVALAAHGWHLVRRPTGGRAILHVDELTYSVAGPENEPRLEGGVLESYRRLSAALLEALHRLHIPAQSLVQPAQPADSGPKGPVCFEVPSNYEIVVDGKKLLGSAQARRLNGVLQHGSLPLYGDLTRITQALHFNAPADRQKAADRLLARAVTAENVLQAPLAWDAAAAAFAAAFEDMLNITLQPAGLTAEETRRAGELVQAKYSDAAWNFRW